MMFWVIVDVDIQPKTSLMVHTAHELHNVKISWIGQNIRVNLYCAPFYCHTDHTNYLLFCEWLEGNLAVNTAAVKVLRTTLFKVPKPQIKQINNRCLRKLWIKQIIRKNLYCAPYCHTDHTNYLLFCAGLEGNLAVNTTHSVLEWF